MAGCLHFARSFLTRLPPDRSPLPLKLTISPALSRISPPRSVTATVGRQPVRSPLRSALRSNPLFRLLRLPWQSLLAPFRSRLSRKVALGVLGSIVAIEVIILVPSYWRRETELVNHLRDVSQAKILAADRWAAGAGRTDSIAGLRSLEKLLVGSMRDAASWQGVAIYTADGRQRLASFGQAPELLATAVVQQEAMERLSTDGQSLDLAWRLRAPAPPCVVIVRHDYRPIRAEMKAFTLRIAGLVAIISLGATAVTMVVLHRVAIGPILSFRNDLRRAADLVGQEGNPLLTACGFYQDNRADELGEVMQAFRQMYDRIHQEIVERRRAEAETEALLLNILPPAIATRLKRGEHPIAERFEVATVLFADLVDFTGFAARLSPGEVVESLNEIFSTFDGLAQKFGLEKIKTIGDAYMVVGGLPNPHTDCAGAMAEMALAMSAAIGNFSAPRQGPFQIRIGIHTGPVVAGVIGINKFIYDLWGDTVNVASRMESHGEAGKIHVSQSVYKHLGDRYVFVPRGAIDIKGKGIMNTYWLTGRRDLPA